MRVCVCVCVCMCVLSLYEYFPCTYVHYASICYNVYNHSSQKYPMSLSSTSKCKTRQRKLACFVVKSVSSAHALRVTRPLTTEKKQKKMKRINKTKNISADVHARSQAFSRVRILVLRASTQRTTRARASHSSADVSLRCTR